MSLRTRNGTLPGVSGTRSRSEPPEPFWRGSSMTRDRCASESFHTPQKKTMPPTVATDSSNWSGAPTQVVREPVAARPVDEQVRLVADGRHEVERWPRT